MQRLTMFFVFFVYSAFARGHLSDVKKFMRCRKFLFGKNSEEDSDLEEETEESLVFDEDAKDPSEFEIESENISFS